MLQGQVKVTAVTKIQSVVRGHLVRKRLSKLSSKEKKKLKSRAGSYAQVVSLEKRYIEKLRSLVKMFLEPLERNPPPGTFNSFHYLSNNIPRILEVHEILLDELEAVQNSAQYPFVANIGMLLSENVDRIGPAYSRFAKYYYASLITLDHFYKNIPRFPMFLEEVCVDMVIFSNPLIYNVYISGIFL